MPSSRTDSTLTRRTAVRIGGGSLAAALALHDWRSAGAHSLTILEGNKALVRRVFEEAVNGGNEALIEELYAPDFVDRGTWARQMPGPAGMPLTIAQFHEVFPDVTVAVEMTIAEDDLVATVATWHGTHPPAGTHVVGRTMHLFRIANEQIIEEWSTGWEGLAQLGYRSELRLTNPLAGA
jgi:predicted SnoaL-like aldol condensation-catalyzing enzyme